VTSCWAPSCSATRLLNVAAAAVTNIVILRLFGASELALLIGTLLITFHLLVFSEIMPKILAASHPEDRTGPPATCRPADHAIPSGRIDCDASSGDCVARWRIKIQTDQSKQKNND